MTDQVEDDPRSSYLLTEARIIAEDDAHVTIAVRLDKATIVSNFPFLSALADLEPHRAVPDLWCILGGKQGVMP